MRALGLLASYLLAAENLRQTQAAKMLHLELEMVEVDDHEITNFEQLHTTNNMRLKASDDDSDIEDDDRNSDSEDEADFDDQISPPSEVFRATKSGYRYQAPIFFGANKDKAVMSFDTSTSFTTVTSDICSNCKTKAYH